MRNLYRQTHYEFGDDMNKRHQHLLLGTLQADAQLLVDYATMFMAKPAFRKLAPALQEEFKEATYSVTASLGRHTMSLLEVNGLSLPRHLQELFPRLEVLGSLSKTFGVQHLAGAFERLRQELVNSGLTYLNSETLDATGRRASADAQSADA